VVLVGEVPIPLAVAVILKALAAEVLPRPAVAVGQARLTGASTQIPVQIEDHPWPAPVPAMAATLVVLSPRFLAHSASQIWNRSSRSLRKWMVWTYQDSGRDRGVRTVRRSSAALCALLRTAMGDRGRWDLPAVRRKPTTRRTILTNAAALLRGLGTDRKEAVIKRRILGLLLEA